MFLCPYWRLQWKPLDFWFCFLIWCGKVEGNVKIGIVHHHHHHFFSFIIVAKCEEVIHLYFDDKWNPPQTYSLLSSRITWRTFVIRCLGIKSIGFHSWQYQLSVPCSGCFTYLRLFVWALKPKSPQKRPTCFSFNVSACAQMLNLVQQLSSNKMRT